MSLLNAEDAVDTGDVWKQIRVHVPQCATFAEINAVLFEAQASLMTWALANCGSARPVPQVGAATHYRKRTPSDSRIDPSRPLSESFDLLRVADPVRYPAFFEIHGRKYKILIEPLT